MKISTLAKRIVTYFLYLFIIVQVAFSSSRDDIIYYTESGYAEFTSRVPLHTFTGKSNDLTGMIDPREGVVDFYLDLNTLETGIGKRDRDMFNTLEVDEYPFAEFTGTLNSSIDMELTTRQDAVVTGEFTMHGVTREVTIQGTLQKNEEGVFLEAEWILNLTHYNIKPPGILFYRVNEEQGIRIEATLLPQNRETVLNYN